MYKNYIVSSKNQESDVKLSSAAIFVNLYYYHDYRKYLGYLDKLSGNIEIYISTSNDILYSALLNDTEGRTGIRVVKKNNRGRDVSALLVTFKEIIRKYDFFCFLHDKKSKRTYLNQDIDFWVDNLWKNTVFSTDYVKNIVQIFKDNNELGLLVPPPPYGNFISDWYRSDYKLNSWGGGNRNYELAKELGERLNLKVQIKKDLSPITLGTVFWARTKSLKKLLEYNWQYEDFDAEPLADDGTISHAIERIFEYVLQDCGYDTRVVMVDEYAQTLMERLYRDMGVAYSLIRNEIGLENFAEIINYKDKRQKLVAFFEKNNNNIYLFGAGNKCEDCIKFLHWIGKKPKGILVSNADDNPSKLLGFEVSNIRNMQEQLFRDSGILITVGYKLQSEIELLFKDMGINNYMFYMDYTP